MAVHCVKCGYNKKEDLVENEGNIAHHHIIPKCFGGTDGDGRIWLCKKCHDRIHKELLKQVWKYVIDKEECKKHIKNYTSWFINRKEK